jgi:hypothetical protein
VDWNEVESSLRGEGLSVKGSPTALGPSVKHTLLHLGRTSRILSRLYLGYLNVVRGGVALNLIGEKPAS